MPGTDRDLVSRLLKQSILALCREAVSYNSRLEVDGIVCVTLDNNIDHVVKIHELFSKPDQSSCTSSGATRSSPSNGDETGHPSATRQAQRHTQHAVKSSARYETKVEPVSSGFETSQQSSISGNRMVPISIPKPVSLLKTNIPEPATAKPVTPKPLPAQLEISTARNITCKKCNAVIDNAKEFERHNVEVHGYFTCMVCLATFTSRNNMKRHLRLHTGVKPYTCNKCDESFARNDDYKRHLLRHTFEKPFRCAVCKSGYSDRSCVKNHMVKEHGSKNFYICPQCGLSFIDAQKFHLHRKTHPEFQDYRCELCSFTGSNSLMYNKHMLTHGTPKRYMCGHCELSFNDPFSYTNHMKRHKGDELVQIYNCCFCDHVSQTYEQFQRHEHSHIQSKQHTCDVCGKHFRYPSNLREHMLTHMSKSALTISMSTATVDYCDLSADSNNNGNAAAIAKRNTIPVSTTTAVSDNSLVRGHENETQKEFEGTLGNDDGNSIEENDDHEAMDEDISGELDACESIGSDYWCTECNQGFGTEDRLQDHIMNTHEDISGIPESPTEQTDADPVNSRRYDDTMFRTSTPASSDSERSDRMNPYELNTQVDSPSGSLYEEDTCSASVLDSEIHTQTYGGPAAIYEEQTQVDNSRFPVPQKAAGLINVRKAPIAKRSRAYDEETVMDEDTTYQSDIIKEQGTTPKRSPVAFSDVEIAIVQDAMKEVQKIQSEYGIKPTPGLNLTSSVSTASSPQLRLALDGRKDKVGFKSPATGIWKTPASINRSRLWLSPQHYINRNDISAGPDEAEDLTTARDKTRTESKHSSKSPATVTSKQNIASVGNVELASKQQYSKTSVLGMDTDFSATPSRGSPTTLNLKMKSPGFEKVVTPGVLFKDRAPFTCEVCDETFPEFEKFDQHGISVHRRFICSWCGKPFTSRPNRERHVRYHTGEKPYKCDVCSSSFFRGDDLKYHRTTKHADIRPFLCGTCKASFVIPKELEKHLRVYPLHRMKEGTNL